MEIFNSDWKLADVIRRNYLLLPVINRFGISLGFGDKTIDEVCGLNHVDTNFFLAIINTYHNEDYFPEKQLQSYSVILIINYLKRTHEYYIDYEIPEIEKLLDDFLTGYKGPAKDLTVLRKFYNDYIQELISHIHNEDEVVFPYIMKLVKDFETKSGSSTEKNTYSIRTFEKEHSNVDEKLFDLKNIILKYLHPSYNNFSCNAFLFALFRLEKDLVDHARIEDKILIPKIIELERKMIDG